MNISKITQQIMNNNGLSFQESAFALLVAAGLTRIESYALIFRPTQTKDEEIAQKASELIRGNKGINKLIEECRVKGLTITEHLQELRANKRKQQQEPDVITDEEREKINRRVEKFADKSYIINLLSSELVNLSPDKRVDAVLKIADLNQMKKEKVINEEKTKYYLPLQCYKCRLFLEHQGRK